MKALITGINGFAGSFLAEELLKENYSVFGLAQPGTSLGNLAAIINKVGLSEIDILNEDGLGKCLAKIKPDIVFHLAGVSSVKESFAFPKKTFEVNVFGTLNILEQIKRHCPLATLLMISSADIYGESFFENKIVDENSAIHPMSPYAISKATLDMFGRSYCQSSGIKVIIARPANHIGPRQSANFFIPSVARKTAEIVLGLRQPELNLGNLGIYRDFTDVRDMARAYRFLAQKGRVGQFYNICSGKSYKLLELVNIFINLSGKNITIVVDPAELRENEFPNMKFDNSKIVHETGWLPNIDIKQTMKDTLEYWVDEIGSVSNDTF